ncbi:MAG: hypothetical protein AB7K86_08525 [Rhodospirillales bacterium]
MNGRKAKALRRQAEAIHPVGRYSLARRLMHDPRRYGVAINDPRSLRGVYRRLKREARA